MNALTVGGLIILYLIASQAIGGFIVNETSPSFLVGDCDDINNQTGCESIDGPSFVESVKDVAVSGFNDAPQWFNLIWVSFHEFLLVIAAALIVSYFAGLFFGGSG